MDTQSPVVLAQVPKSVLGSNGKIQFGSCYGLSESRKRKRFEIAAAVDGETLNIYNVRRRVASGRWTQKLTQKIDRSISTVVLICRSPNMLIPVPANFP
jgi:hypothetical protein